MANSLEFSTEDIKRRKDEAYLAVTMFDVARRKIYLHTRQEEPEDLTPMPRSATRSMGHWYVLLTSNCHYCHAHHTCLSRSAYLEWYSKLPFLCEHGNVITSIQVEPIPEVAREYPHCFLPSRLVRLDPDIVSNSSVGLPIIDKLKRDQLRLDNTFGKAMSLMGALINFVREARVDG